MTRFVVYTMQLA